MQLPLSLPLETTPTPLPPIPVDRVRVGLEATALARLGQDVGFRTLASRIRLELDPERVRRRLLAEALQLSHTMAPDLHRVARETAKILSVNEPLELYQAAGRENARIHLVRSPVLLEVQGRLLSLLDEEALRALVGHELGHALAHGDADGGGVMRAAAHKVLEELAAPPAVVEAARAHSLACELTADRFGLLACQDLSAALRLTMICTTGLSGATLSWDTDAYLAQCVSLCEGLLRAGEVAQGLSHPEHGLRTYALWLFSESDLYHTLTGRGSGTRPIAEVEATLVRLVGLAPAPDDAARELFEVPLVETWEFALAGAVMVAWADGHLDESEVEALEGVFAPLVPDWRRLLDPEAARARFALTLPLMRAAGSQQIQALFQVLVHVMAADGQVTTAEVEVVLGIGQALGRLDEFATRLRVSLDVLGIALRVEDIEPEPLAVSAAEVRAALDIFLESVRRRGGGQVSLRRLLQLVGEQQRTGGGVARLQAALAAAQVTTAADLATVDLDVPIGLLAPPPEPPPAPAAPLAGVRAELHKAVLRLREKLVSGDGRSPSVRLTKARPARVFDLFRLDAVKTGQALRVLTAIQGGQGAALVTAEEAGRHGPAHRCVESLTALDRTARDQIEETGAHDLFLGYPVVRGDAGRGDAASRYLVRAPLVLYPVDLIRDARGARGFRVAPRADEEPVVNLALVRAIFHKRGLALPDTLVDELNARAADPALGVPAVLAYLASVGLEILQAPAPLGAFEDIEATEMPGPLVVEERALIGIFPQSSSDLLADYDGLLRDLADPRADLAALLGAAHAVLPAALRAEFVVGAPTEVPPPRPPVVSADPSQRAVVAEARRHAVMVVDGPPGTGKSQVIVNLVADALARGERVAVVCEKRAALDVVCQRITALGLRSSLAVVHDLNDDRKPLFEQLAARLEGHVPRGFDPEEAAEFARTAQQHTQALTERAADLGRRLPGSALTWGQLLLLAQAEGGHEIPKDFDGLLASLGDAERAALAGRVRRLHALEPVWRRGGRWRGPGGEKWGRLVDEAALAQAREDVVAAARATDAVDVLLVASGVTLASVQAAGPALEAAADRLAGLPADLVPSVARCLHRLAADAHGLAPLTAAVAAYDAHAAVLAPMARGEILEGPTELVAVGGALRQWHARWLRVFVPAWWRARGALRALVQRLVPDLAGQAPGVPLLEALEARLAASRAWQAVVGHFQALGLGPLPDEPARARARLAELAEAAAVARTLLSLRGSLEAAQAWVDPPADPSAAPAWAEAARTRLAERRALLEADARRHAAVDVLETAFPWLGARPLAQTLRTLDEALAEGGAQLIEIDELLGREAPPVLHLVDALAPTAGPEAWAAALTGAWARARADHLVAQHPSLRDRGTAAEARRALTLTRELAELQKTLAGLEVERIAHGLDRVPLLAEPQRAPNARKTPLQAVREDLLKEVSKKRRLMTLRAFVRRFAGPTSGPSQAAPSEAGGLLDLLPVWLLSPESLAVLFPRAPAFDLIIFDEASQCTVEAGFPVLLRGRRAVVAGDEHQMPPTSFFRTTDDDEAGELPEEEVAVRDVFASESLLTLARGRCAHQRLRWHYRCLHESLIAFSNHAIYNGDLQTIPHTATPRAARALRWIAVPDGAYDDGANPPEARRVVAALDDLLVEDPTRTLGVITFNIKQRRAVLDAVDARQATDEAFAARWAAAMARPLDERPFVKNLESVQGDERDIILFSLAHTPRPRKGSGAQVEYSVPARFGPLGQRGGERRLNVAISRARQACYVVSSFVPEQLSVAAATHRGPQLFRQFIEFAHRMDQGRLPEAHRILDHVRSAARRVQAAAASALPAEVTLPAQIAQAIEALGGPVERQVGTSGFTIPVAVFDPHDPHRFKLAILVEDGTEVLDPFDVCIHRPAVLALRGWQVLRVTAADWIRRRDAVLQAITDALPGLQGALARDPWRALTQGEAAASTTHPWPTLAAPLRPLADALDHAGHLTREQATRLLNARAFDRLRFALAELQAAGGLPWKFEVVGEGEDARLQVVR